MENSDGAFYSSKHETFEHPIAHPQHWANLCLGLQGCVLLCDTQICFTYQRALTVGFVSSHGSKDEGFHWTRRYSSSQAGTILHVFVSQRPVSGCFPCADLYIKKTTAVVRPWSIVNFMLNRYHQRWSRMGWMTELTLFEEKSSPCLVVNAAPWPFLTRWMGRGGGISMIKPGPLEHTGVVADAILSDYPPEERPILY